MISAILLSAGLSSRFGSPKALAPFKEGTVISHVQEVLMSSLLSEIIIVLGAYVEDIKPYILNHKKVKVVYNKDYNLGQTSSFKVGLSSISEKSQGMLLLPVDYPVVRGETIDLLCQEFEKTSPRILIPTYQGKKGHPPVFSVEIKSEFMELNNSKGLNQISHRHKDETRYLEVKDIGVVTTFNTPEEFKRLKALLI